MGRKGSWFAAIKRVFVPNSKEKSTDGQEKKTTKEKKKGRRILRAGESRSFIPLFREPSSIEKILGEVDEEIIFRPPISSEPQKSSTFLPYRPTSPRIVSPGVASPPQAASSSMPSLPRVASPGVSPPRTTYQKVSSPKLASPRVSPPRPTYQKVAPPKVTSPTVSPHGTTFQRVTPPKSASPRITHKLKEVSYTPEPTSRDLQMSAIKIQTAFRGYIARRSFKALRGLMRLQGVVKGQSVKRQTMNAMKQMQLLVRVQTQIHSRRTEMLGNQALQRQSYKNVGEMESTVSKWTYNQLVDGNNEEWDDSVLTKEERAERLRKRAEAVIKRERGMSYAYSNQLWKPQQKSARGALGGFPWWGNWLEDHVPPSTTSERQTPKNNIHLTPPRPTSGQKRSPWLQASSYNHNSYTPDNHEQLTPRSSKSSIPIRGKQLLQTPSRTPPSNSSSSKKYIRSRANATNSRFGVGMRDDDSLTSCPPFSVPNYMQPTISAKAKMRANSNPKERLPGTPGNESKRMFSFLLTPSNSPFKWNRGSGKYSSSPRVMEKQQSVQSTDDRMSIGSAVSMPAAVGRRPFNRYV
ncbi:hypothetical protein LIER_15131 [Lithospermum erythrorhizon]|uniref:DUF4005 domain-containing protein n=1 Tax=Lithospermum erythrorhizon TaxID=34254 RepID=A0AAV3Q1S8_LITER